MDWLDLVSPIKSKNTYYHGCFCQRHSAPCKYQLIRDQNLRNEDYISSGRARLFKYKPQTRQCRRRCGSCMDGIQGNSGLRESPFRARLSPRVIFRKARLKFFSLRRKDLHHREEEGRRDGCEDMECARSREGGDLMEGIVGMSRCHYY